MSDQKIQTGTKAATNAAGRIAAVSSPSRRSVRAGRSSSGPGLKPRGAPQQPLSQPELFTAPGLGEDSGDRNRRRDYPHEESDDSDERPTRPNAEDAERGADPVGPAASTRPTSRMKSVPGLAFLSEPGEVVKSDDDQGDDRGQQLDREQCAQRGAVDLGETGGDSADRPLLASIRQSPVAELPRPANRASSRFPRALIPRANSSNVARTNFTPRRGSTSCGAR